MRSKLALGAVALLGIGLLLNGLWIPAKASLAQVLLERSWDQSRATGVAQKPWPWADHTAIAQIEAPAQGVRQIVLSGDTGRSLAFAPGLNEASGRDGEAIVVSAHRDTHFQFLKDVALGEPIVLTTTASRRTYEVVGTAIVDSSQQQLDPTRFPDGLILVTCYPFEAWDARGPLRYVVFATPFTETSAHQSS